MILKFHLERRANQSSKSRLRCEKKGPIVDLLMKRGVKSVNLTERERERERQCVNESERERECANESERERVSGRRARERECQEGKREKIAGSLRYISFILSYFFIFF